MRIAYLAAGAGIMYCGACARDVTLVRALLARHHDVQLIPLYTPLKLEQDDLPTSPIFMGGINVFLQQAFALFRALPMPLDRFLDHPAFLRLIAKVAIEVEPKNLGPMTVSVLEGRDGRQKKELERLLQYLESSYKPDLLNLTNSLLSGLAPEIKRRLHIPVICTFQGEDTFVADLPEPHRSRARDLIRQNAQAIDLFICPNETQADDVAAFLAVPRPKVRVIRTAVAIPPTNSALSTQHSAPFTIGYLSVIRPIKGLDLLLDALAQLIQKENRQLRLRVAGRIMNKPYWKTILQKVRTLHLADHFDYLGELDAPAKASFFQQCSVFCVPSRYPEPRGVAVLEAMAAALPIVAPATGVFPELFNLADTPARPGILVPSNNPSALAHAFASMIDHPAQTQAQAHAAQTLITRHCTPDQMVTSTLAAYEQFAPPNK